MGSRPGINLDFDHSRIEEAVLGTARMAVLTGDTARVRTSSGRIPSLPFSIEDESDECEVIAGHDGVCFTPCLRHDFDPDDGGTDYDVDGVSSAILAEYLRTPEGRA